VENRGMKRSSTMDWGLGRIAQSVMNGGFPWFGLWKTRIKSGENGCCKFVA
jgi:hypothetical protein